MNGVLLGAMWFEDVHGCLGMNGRGDSLVFVDRWIVDYSCRFVVELLGGFCLE